MKGSIRTFVGFLLVFGSVGGMDTAPEAEMLLLSVLSGIGLFLMYSGVQASKEL